MQSLPEIRDGSITDLNTLVELFSDSFADDPVMNWVLPDPNLYPDFFRLIIEEVFLPRGIIHLEQRGLAGAMWLPPGRSFDIPPRLSLLRMIVQLILRKGPKPLLRIRQQSTVFGRHLPREPHYHLLFIGARRANQGAGLGSILLKQGTRMCDEASIPAYLESSNELNLPLYRRHGFEVIAQEALPGGGPTAWFMWREPRS